MDSKQLQYAFLGLIAFGAAPASFKANSSNLKQNLTVIQTARDKLLTEKISPLKRYRLYQCLVLAGILSPGVVSNDLILLKALDLLQKEVQTKVDLDKMWREGRE